MKIKIFFLTILMLCFSMTVFADDAENEGQDVSVTSSQEMMEVISEGRVPNYQFSIGLRGGYFLPMNNIAELIDPFFVGNLYFRYNPDDIFKGFAGTALQGLIFELDVDFTAPPIKNADASSLYIISPTFGIRYGIPLGNIFTLIFYTNYGAMINIFDGKKTDTQENYANFIFKGGIDIEFELAYHSDISIGVNYRTPFVSNDVQGISLYASYSYRIGGEPRENQLKITNPSLSSVFPALNTIYGSTSPVGSVTLTNTGEDAIEDVQVAIYIDGFMSSPSASPENYELAASENLIVPLYAVFNNNIMQNQNDQILTAEIVVRYSIEGSTYTKRESSSLMIYNKNALIWEPVERVAAFCSPDDPAIKDLRSAVETQMQDSNENSFITGNIRRAMKAFELLKSFNLQYLADPNKPFAVSEGGSAQAVDTIQFPSEFLMSNRLTGDCDDCSILYTSLLESFAVPAGFILTPEHIFTMFNTGIPEQSIGMVTEDRNKVIIYEGYVWIPIEATFLDRDRPGFIEAWDMAIEEYHSNSSRITLVSVEQAWQRFPYVVYTGDTSNIATPDYNAATSTFHEAVLAYRQTHRATLDRALSVDVATLAPAEQREAAAALIQNNSPQTAIPILEGIAGDGESDFQDYFYLATAYFQSGIDYLLAIEHYNTAASYLNDQNLAARYLPRIYLNIAQCYNKLDDIYQQVDYYNRAYELNPSLAHRMAYLGGDSYTTSSSAGAMASDVTQQTIPLLLD